MEDDLDLLVMDAWRRLYPTLQNDPAVLAARLARRRTAALRRPPREWCLVVRATDHRIDPATAAIVPEGAVDVDPTTGQVRPHAVTVDAALMRRLGRPILLAPPGEPHDDVARKLGVRPGSLTTARLRGVFHTHHVPGLGGRRGNPVPLLYTRANLRPANRLFAEPDRAWSWTADFMVSRIPDDLSQTLQRVPVYRDRTKLLIDAAHPEAAEPPRRSPSKRLPPPEPDYVGYKWKDGVYVDHDWRNPLTAARYQREEAAKARQRERRKQRRRENPPPSRGGGSLQFRGWRWLCPGCGRKTRVLYYPLAPMHLLQWEAERLLKIDELDELFVPPPCFACDRCHRVRHVSRADRNAWNQFITYLSGGLLYGREVPRPTWFQPTRQRPYKPQSRRDAPQRVKVLRRLLNGWSSRKIARDLQIGLSAVGNHIHALCKQEGVPNRHALAKKLGAATPPPPNQDERAAQRREQVCALLLEGKSYKEIMAELELDWSTVNRDTDHLYKQHHVHGRKQLCAKLGRPLRTKHDDLRDQIRERLHRGERCKQIVSELGVKKDTVHYHAKMIRKEQRSTNPDAMTNAQNVGRASARHDNKATC